MEIKISGIEEIQALLDGAPARIVKNSFARALAASAVPVARALVARAPKLTGDMVEHLVTDIEIDSQGKGGHAQIGFGKEGWKARLVETGHRMVGHKPAKQDIGAVVAHPFMGPAAAESADAAIEAFTESMAESLSGDLLKRTG